MPIAGRKESGEGKTEGNFSVVQAGKDKCKHGVMAVGMQRKRHIGKMCQSNNQQVMETDLGSRKGQELRKRR